MESITQTVEKDYVQEIKTLVEQKNAVILAHYYQRPEIQLLADFVGDSLDLAKKARATDAEIIVFAGVRFMAETAKILNPDRKVLLPDMEAGCSLDDNCPPDAFQAFINQYPGHAVVSYINCSAEVKAMSDVICTSSNAKQIVEQIPKGKPIVFAPDANLGRYISQQTGRDMVLWPGACEVHVDFSLTKLNQLRKKYPNAELIAHPEAEQVILDQASFIGSTKKLINYVQTSLNQSFIVATEGGILHEMRSLAPEKILVAAPSSVNNSCACSECSYMKRNTLKNLHECLVNEEPEIVLEESLRQRALKPLEQMFNWS